MLPNLPPPHGEPPESPFQPGQTLIFLGDHTTPDDAGYVAIVADVLDRFRPELRLNLISAGSKGQTASGLRSRALLDILSSSRPDWLVIGLGLPDAMHEPVARQLLQDYRAQRPMADEVEAIFGPEHHVHDVHDLSPVSDVGPAPSLPLEHLDAFRADLGAAVAALQQAEVRCILLTIALVGNNRDNPVNGVVRNYNRAIREVAQEQGCPLVDVERSFRDMFDRAATYKQKVALTGPQGELNVQGQTLLARAFMSALGLLPSTGQRPR